MSLKAEVDAIYQALIGTGNVRYRQYPAAAAAVAIADDAAWDEITDSTTSPQTDFMIAGLNITYPNAGITADTEEVLAVGSGGANGAVVAAAVLLIEHEVIAAIDTAVGEYPTPPVYLPVPVRVIGATRIAARISSSITGGMAVGLGYTAITGLGT